MKTKITLLIITIIILIILFVACEKRKDPFSVKNNAPKIEDFSFVQSSIAKDSLKFTKAKPFKIILKYADNEKQQLTATFNFLSGHGDLFHSRFKKISETPSSITFDAPSEFNSDLKADGKLNFIPDTTGKVEIELELSDKVKISTEIAETFFYDNLTPLAKFTVIQLTNVSPYKIEVNADSSNDRDGTIEWYYWNFDDDTPVVKTDDETLQHTYRHAGTYTINLKVQDNDSGVDSTEQVVSTNNQPPLAILQVNPKSGEAPLTIEYTATNSSDPDGDIVSYRIDFDDGISSLDSIGTHTYTTDDNYNVKLTVQDNLGQIDTTSINVNVETPPVAVLKVIPTEGTFPLDCDIDGSDSNDPQGGKLKHDILIDNELTYENIERITHTFETPKRYQITLQVTSERNGLRTDTTQFVSVNNTNPVADFTYWPESPQHTVKVKYTSTSFDPDSTDEITFYKWIFPNDPRTLQGADSSNVEHIFDAGIIPYKVILEVQDKFGGNGRIEKEIN